MANQIEVTWQVILEDSEWNSDKKVQLPSEPSRDIMSRETGGMRAFSTRVLWGAVLLLLLAAAAASISLWRQAQAGLEQLEAELNEVIQLEEWGAHAGKATVDVQQVDLWGNQAMVQLRIRDPQLPLPYRETRFYHHQGNAGWQPGMADVTFWGSEQTVESNYFLVHLRHRDLAAVATAAPRLDERIRQLLHSFGLPELILNEKILVHVVVDEGQPTTWHGPGLALRVPSPLLLSVPVTVSEDEVLVRSVLLPFSSWLLDQALARYPLAEDWQISRDMYKSLQLWMLWDSDGRLADWQRHLVRWTYAASPELPDQYAAICQTYAAWSILPDDAGSPLACGDAHGERAEMGKAVIRLSQLVPAINQYAAKYSGSVEPTYGWNARAEQWQMSIAAATVLGYAVHVYGRERLPALLAALDDPRSWEGIIPAVFGVPAEEFEAGWHAYLVEAYGVDRAVLE